MTRPTNRSHKLLLALAERIRAESESLIEQYDARLADRPGYDRLPAPMRRDLERQLLGKIADALAQGDSHELIEHVRQRAVQWVAGGLEVVWFQAGLIVPEEILVPLIDSAEASTFLWQALNRCQATVWQIVAERAHTVEQTLRQSQQLLQAVMDNIPQAVFWKDRTLTYLGCNRAFAEAAGLASPLDIVGKTDFDMPWRAQADLYRADDAAVIDRGRAKINYEEPQTTPTGEQTWLRTSKVPMHDATGQVTAVLGMYEDITERKHTEEALAQERNLLRTLIDNLPDQIFFKDTAGRIILHNMADARVMGMTTTEEALGQTVYDLYPHDLADLYHADDMTVIQSDRPLFDREEPNIDNTGQQRWVLTTKIPLKDAQGNRLGLVGMARDITARRQAELNLQQSEERFRRFSEATFEGLVFHTAGIILDANPAIVKAFGYSAPEDFIGHQLLEFIAPESRALVVQQMQLEDVPPYEIACIRLDGSIFPVETATRTYQYGGHTVRASSMRDITRRKELEQSIRDSYERRGRQVEVSRQVAQEIATATDVDAIFPLVVNLIKERFAYYHAQIFRYDPILDAVVLVAGYSEAGQRMLAAGHRIPMGRGVVGMAAQTGKAILATDSTLDAGWQPNPNLPDTKGEVAVPIKFQDEILGILDVQSDRANALTQDDVLLLEGLAGQIAVAIAGTRTLEEANTFRALVEAAGQGIAFARPDGQLTFVNAAIARMFGLPGIEAIIGRQVTHFYPETERARVQTAVAQAMEHGQWTGELTVQPADGSPLVSTINNVFTVKNRKGHISYIANIITDITERTRVEQRLAEAVRLARIGYWSYDVATDQFTFNDQFYALMRTTAVREGGYAMSSAQYTARFVHPADAAVVGAEIGKALATTDPHYRGEVSHRIYFGDGELGYVTVRFTIEKDAQGRTIRTAGANQDITAIRLAEQELRTHETQLSQALQIAKLAYWEYDVEQDLFLFNDQFFSIFHTTAEQHGGYQLSSGYYAQHFVHPDDLAIVGAEIEQALNSTDRHYNRSLEHRIVYDDGGIGYITVSININRDEQGRILRYYGANQDITERKLAEQALARSADLLNTIFTNSRDLIYIKDRDSRFQIASQAVADLIGAASPADLLGKNDFDFFQPDLAQKYFADEQRIMDDGKPLLDAEEQSAYPDGTRIWLLTTKIPYRSADGKVDGIVGIGRDITERKLAEEAIRRSESALSQALQIAKLAYWEYDVEQDLFLFNDQFFSIFHTTADQHGGYQLTSAYYAEHFVYSEDLPIVGAEIEQALNSTDRHYSRSLEHRILYADGGIGHISVNINIDRNEQGQILRYYGANQDITERKRAEANIRETQERSRIIAETTPIPIMITSTANGTVLYGNERAGEVFGLSMDQFLGQTMPDFYADPADRQVLLAQIRRDGSVHDYELHVRRADGTLFWVLLSMQPLVFAGQRALFAAFIDITASRQAAEALRQSQAQLADALRIAQLANWSYDVPTDTFTFNDQFYALMRTTAAREGSYTMTSAHYTQRFVHPDDAPLVGMEIVKALEASDPSYRAELTHRVYFGDGDLGYVTVRFTIEQDEHGRTVRTLGVNQNVTAAKLAELEREQLLQDVQRRANQVEAVAEVGAASAALLEPQALLASIVRLTRRRFNLYHCHIFLLDEAGQMLTVRACGWCDAEDQNRPAGESAIRLDAPQSLVARAARTRQPVIVNDVHTEPGWLPNPLLPNIQSEIALPMIVGDIVLGVFNAHADERNHFTDEDAHAMTALATQAAVALQNARLFEQTQRTAEELDQLNRRLTGEAWEAYLQRKAREHVILAKSNNPAAPDALPVLNESLAAGQVVVEQLADQSAQTITTPIVLRGQTVGALRVQADSEGWSEDVQSVLTSIASHIAQAAENTRLLEESEIRFARERTLAEATDKVRRNTEVQQVLQTAAAELARYLNASTVAVRMSAGTASNGQGDDHDRK